MPKEESGGRKISCFQKKVPEVQFPAIHQSRIPLRKLYTTHKQDVPNLLIATSILPLCRIKSWLLNSKTETYFHFAKEKL